MNDTVDGRNPAPPGMYKPCKQWDKVPINWCRISSINSMYPLARYLNLLSNFLQGYLQDYAMYPVLCVLWNGRRFSVVGAPKFFGSPQKELT